jgi:hypothetical protein
MQCIAAAALALPQQQRSRARATRCAAAVTSGRCADDALDAPRADEPAADAFCTAQARRVASGCGQAQRDGGRCALDRATPHHLRARLRRSGGARRGPAQRAVSLHRPPRVGHGASAAQLPHRACALCQPQSPALR